MGDEIINKIKKTVGLSIIGSAVMFSAVTYIVGSMIYDGSVGSVPAIAKDDMIDYYKGREDKLLDKLDNYKYNKLFVKSSINNYDIEGDNS
ncbi:MAG: hypothetical protein RSA01_09085 [Clostridium sp.]